MKIGPQDFSAYTEAAGPASGRAANQTGAETRAALIRAGTVAGALGGGSAAGATVKLSTVATGALSAASQSADVDLDKVRRVQAELAQGSYRVNPDAIADGLIASAQSFLRPSA